MMNKVFHNLPIRNLKEFKLLNESSYNLPIRSLKGSKLIFTEALYEFKKLGAVIWDENIITSNSSIYKWNCSSNECLLKQKYDFKQYDPFTVSKELYDFLQYLLIIYSVGKLTCERGVNGPYTRRIHPHTNYGDFHLRDDWHTDSYNSLTLIIPITQFTMNNGCTQLLSKNNGATQLRSNNNGATQLLSKNNGEDEIIHFLGEPFKPLIMNGSTLHRQSANNTDFNRDALVLQIDSGAFE